MMNTNSHSLKQEKYRTIPKYFHSVEHQNRLRLPHIAKI